MSMPSNNFWDAVPEFDQHEVRYSEYVLKSPKNPVLPEKRKFLIYGVGPIVDPEIDDDDDEVDYSKYVLPRFYTENAETTQPAEEKQIEKKHKQIKKQNGELSLDSIYEKLREIKLSKIQKIIKASVAELSKTQTNRPSSSFLSVAKQLYSTMFNPEQKYWIYTCIRNTLNIPPHSFRDVPHIYTVLAPKTAVIIFQKTYKIDSVNNAVGKLSSLELLNPTFYSDKAKVNIHCRT